MIRRIVLTLFLISVVFPQKGSVVGVSWSNVRIPSDSLTSSQNGWNISIHSPFEIPKDNLKSSVGVIYSRFNNEKDGSKYLWFYGGGVQISLLRILSLDAHAGILNYGSSQEYDIGRGFRIFMGVNSERLDFPVGFKLGWISFNGDNDGFNGWDGINLSLSYNFSQTGSRSSSSGPSAPRNGQGGKIERPADCGSTEIDNFKNAAFDLNDKIVELKEKLKGVSNGLAESNTVLAEIAAHSEGPLGWSRQQVAIAILKATQGPTFNVETNPAVEKVLTAFKEAEGSLQEKIVIAIAKASEESDVLVAIDMDKLITLKIDYDPTKMIREKLGTLKTGVVDGAEELKSVPDDLKAIGEQAKSLLASAGELPKAAKSLGFKKARVALKSIKATTGVLKNIPNEVTSIGDESKKVMEEIDKVLKNIQSILSTT